MDTGSGTLLSVGRKRRPRPAMVHGFVPESDVDGVTDVHFTVATRTLFEDSTVSDTITVSVT